MSKKPRIFGAVEIGTTTIKVIIGTFKRRKLLILGFAERPASGVVNGSITDYDAAFKATHNALLGAERDAAVRINEVYLAQTGAHIDGFFNEASVKVTTDDRVRTVDINAACQLAKAKPLPEGRMVVHHLPRHIRLNGRLEPDGQRFVGQSLEVGYWLVHGQESKIADNLHVIRGYNAPVAELILSSLSSSVAVTTGEERQAGVLVIDIGGGTTDYVIYRDGRPYVTGVVSVGGGHITSDLCLGLRLTEKQAEKLKLRFGQGTVTVHDEVERVWLNGDFAVGNRQFSRQAIERITASRIGEIFDVVKARLGTALAPEHTAAGVVLTGGTSKLPRIANAASQVFEISTRLGAPQLSTNKELCDPSYSTALGLLYFANSAIGRTSTHS